MRHVRWRFERLVLERADCITNWLVFARAGSFAEFSVECRVFDMKRDIQKASASSIPSLLMPGRGGVVPLAGRPKDFLRT